MRSIKEILRDVLNRLGLAQKIEEHRVLLLWDDVASAMSARTQAVEVSHGRMVVNVTDSVILHTLSFYKKRYIDKINLMMGRQIIKDIVFRVGRIEKRNRVVENRNDYIKRLHSIQLDQDELERIDGIVAQIEDEDIRNSLRELFINQSKLFKMRGEGKEHGA